MISALVWIALAVRLAGQQPNLPDATMTVDGHDNGQYPLMVARAYGQTATFDLAGVPFSPFIVVAGSLAHEPSYFGSIGLLHIDLTQPIGVLADGFDPIHPLAPQSVTGAGGTATSGSMVLNETGEAILQALVVSPIAAAGLRFTAATRFIVADGAVTRVPFTAEDETLFVPFASGGSFTFAGTAYTGLWVNSNGSLTFGAGDPNDEGSATAMLAGPPRVAIGWRDLDPTTGEVHVFEHNGIVTVDWFDITALDAVSGAAEDRLSGTVVLDMGGGDVEITVTRIPDGEHVVGFSPGGGALLPSPIDLSASVPVVVPAGEAVFENFTGSFDLLGVPLVWSGPDASGDYTVSADIGPEVTETFPPVGPDAGLATLVVRGRGLLPGTQVLFDGVPAVDVAWLTNEELLVKTPLHAPGVVDLEVQVPGQTSVVVPSAYEYQVLTSIGTAVPFAPQVSIPIPFQLGYVFPFYGTWYDTVFLNSNGTITFGAPDATVTPSQADMDSGPPRIAVLWNDWQPTPTSFFAIHFTPYFLTLALTDVVSAGGGSPTTISVILSHHGEVFLQYEAGWAPPATDSTLTGVTPGGGLAPGGFVDASVYAGPSVANSSLFEIFDAANPLDLMGLDWDLVPTTIPSPIVAPSFLSSTHN